MFLWGRPVEYWLGLDRLAKENNLDSNMIAEYYRVSGELEYIKSQLFKLVGDKYGKV
jgi:hypothetical protein